jgi:hypothetical protein
MMTRRWPVFVAILCVSPAWAQTGPPPKDSTSVHAPKLQAYSYDYDLIDNSVVRPATRFFDVARLARRVSAHPRQAANVDASDQVRLPSTWWQPRAGYQNVTPEDLRTGPGPGTGPAPGRWTVTHAKIQGVSPGFQIKDASGAGFLVKFDPPGHPGLTCSLDVIGSRLFWAAGYNVPDNTISSMTLANLDIGKDATYTDAHGAKQPITLAYIEKLLERVSPPIDGHYVCSTSRFLDGKPIGPYSYEGRRKDDPEDLVPHELRRELRGLWVMCAWLNHADSRGPNSLDTWVKGEDRSFVRHHLIDFNAILGAGATGSRSVQTGSEYYVDEAVGTRALLSLGMLPFAWEASVDPDMASVGSIEAVTFDPTHWRPDYPNPAFDERTERDNRWGARILAGISDDLIREAVREGQYPDPRAAEYMVRVLITRRDRLVQRWLAPKTVTPMAVNR